MLVSVNSYALCDGTLSGGVAISQLRYDAQRGDEIITALPGEDSDIFDRGWRAISLSFTVYRVHANAGAAEAFITGLDAALPNSGSVVITYTGSITTFTVPGTARAINHSSEQLGSTTITSYRITSINS